MTTNFKETVEETIHQELGRISGLFMSQGDTRVGDIIMPTEELMKSSERIMELFTQHHQDLMSEVVERMIKIIEREHTKHYAQWIPTEEQKGYRKAQMDIIKILENLTRE